MASSPLDGLLALYVHQYLREQKFEDAAHKFEQQSRLFFDLNYFEFLVLNGEWNEAEKYFSSFTGLEDNRFSMKVFFEIRKMKFYEAIDEEDRNKALEILRKELNVFKELLDEFLELITFDYPREEGIFVKGYKDDVKAQRPLVFKDIKKLIEANPLFKTKLQFPHMKTSTLRTLMIESSQKLQQLSLNCPRPNMNTAKQFHHQSGSQMSGACSPYPAIPQMNIQGPTCFPQQRANGQSQPAAVSLPRPVHGSIVKPSSIPHPATSGGYQGVAANPSADAALKRPTTSPTSSPAVDYQPAESEHVLKRSRTSGTSDTVSLPMTSIYKFPTSVVSTLNQGSSVMTMDFHNSHSTLLLVGTIVGDIAVWEVASKERIVVKHFQLQDLPACSVLLQEALVKDPAISVNRVMWSPNGSQFGVAYSKHIVHLYNYNGHDELVPHLEIDAHVGGVNDLAFSQPNEKLCIVTCGDDKAIKVWDVVTGVAQYSFQGHESPVYSICPQSIENIQFILSSSADGKVNAWFYDSVGPKYTLNAPGRCCTSMAYSADGTRMFSCGTSNNGDPYIMEWGSDRSTKRTYHGLGKQSKEGIQFDTISNQFLAAGDEFMVKFWDMDNTNILETTNAQGGLPASPRIRLNKFGSLLAVSTIDNCIKIVTNDVGISQLLENQSNAYRATSEAMKKTPTISPFRTVNPVAGTHVAVADQWTLVAAALNADSQSLRAPSTTNKPRKESESLNFCEISEPSQCQSLRLPDSSMATKVSRLTYTHCGTAILALISTAMHKLWKWKKNDRNVTGKASACVPPELWCPSSNLFINDIDGTNPEAAVSCFTVSNNDAYVVSASGGKISQFNLLTFKAMKTFKAPPPAATFLALHSKDNYIIAIGMEDSSIQIYNILTDELKITLCGHSKRVTGLAFSDVLNVLVSSAADAQLFVWSTTDEWEMKGFDMLQLPAGCVSGLLEDTQVQFHLDQIHFLVVNKSQLAIYKAPQLDRRKQWVPREATITHATYSCDSQVIYSSFDDGSVCVFTSATLELRCRITRPVYLHSNPSSRVYPLVIAAHPSNPNQFALGLTYGGVVVLEPLESEGKWEPFHPSKKWC